MKAAIFKKPGVIAVEDIDKPTIQNPTDAVVRVVRACVCGSDLWWYRGIESQAADSQVGHEAIGVVDQIGDGVTAAKVGDLVIIPFGLGCGECPNCKKGLQTACVKQAFLGTGQSEYAYVPNAQGSLVVVPEGDYTDEQLASFLTISDVLGTGYHAMVSAEVKAGDTVAVVGDGAVGLSAVLSAKMLGAARIIVLGSTHESRHKLARKWGATDIITVRGDAAVAELQKLTDGIGADAVLECVGSKDAVNTAFAITRGGGIVGRVGLPQKDVALDVIGTFFRNVGMRGGPAPTKAYAEELLKMVIDGTINPGEVFDFTTDLEHIDDAYKEMDERRTIKSLIKVSEI